MELFTNLWFTLGITSIMAVVAVIYYFKGRSAGIVEVLERFNELEPEAYKRVINKLKARLENDQST